MLHGSLSRGWCFYYNLWYSPQASRFRHYTLKPTKSEYQNLNISLSTIPLCFSTSNHQNCEPFQKTTTRVYMSVPPPTVPLQKTLFNFPLQDKPKPKTRSSQAKPIRLTVEKEKFFVKKKNARKDKK